MSAQPADPAPSLPAPHLRVVEHEHVWELRGVEYCECGAVQELACKVCGDVWFQ